MTAGPTGAPEPSTEDALYQRYREALRTGHLAGLRGATDVAVAAYVEAAGMLPDRSAPHVAIGKALLAAHRYEEAQEAFEAARERSPNDSSARDGAAQALLALDRRSEAADVLDGLAMTYVERDRTADAIATLVRALEIAPSRWRRTSLDRLRAGESAADASWLGELPEDPADRDQEPPGETEGPAAFDDDTAPITDTLRRIAADVERASAADDVAGLVAGAQALLREGRLRAAVDACHDALSVAPADPDVHRTLAAIYRRRGWERAARQKVELVERYQLVVDDPSELEEDADRAEAAGDVPALLAIATRHAEQGRIPTALDLCFRAMALAPTDPQVHLAIAGLHLGIGWRRRAVDEVARLARLVELSGDPSGAAAVREFVNRRLAPPRTASVPVP